MTDIEPFDDEEDVWLDPPDDVAAAPPPMVDTGPPPRRRRRVRMGELLSGLGPAGRAAPGLDAAKTLEQRARAEQSRRLEEGGKNKGEQKGYGLATPDRDG